MTIIWFFILLGIGILLGFINTLGGGASILSWPILILFGLSPHEATGTTAIASLSQTISASYSYFKNKVPFPIDWNRAWQLRMITAIVGSCIGAYLVSFLSPSTFKAILSTVIVVLAIWIWIQPKGLLEKDRQPIAFHWQILLLLLSGMYAGGIQAGMGIVFLFLYRLGLALGLLESNYLKVMTIFILQVPALVIFSYYGHVRWQVGLVLAIGSAIGAGLAVQINLKKGADSIKKALFFTSILLILSLFKDKFG